MTLRQTCKRQVGIVRQEKKPNDAAQSGSEPQRCSDVLSPSQQVQGDERNHMSGRQCARSIGRRGCSGLAIGRGRVGASLKRRDCGEMWWVSEQRQIGSRVAPKHQRRAEPDVVQHAATWSRASVKCPVIRLMTGRCCTENVVSARPHWLAAADTWAGCR